MYSNFLTKFPEGVTPYPNQVDTLNQIEKAYKEGYKYVICRAPTGSGKSMISKTLGNASNECTETFRELIDSYKAYRQEFGGTYMYEDDCRKEPAFGAFALTITKSLQDQYANLFDESAVLKGKSNYQCKVDDTFDVDTAPCILTPSLKEECWIANKCPYYNARNRALTDKFGILNYKMFMSLPGHVKRKNFIICDEASELEDELVKQFSLFIDPDKFLQLGLKVPYLYSDDVGSIVKWLNSVAVNITEFVNELLEKLKDKKKPFKPSDKLKLSYFRGLLNTLKQVLEVWSSCEYVCQREGKTVKLQPLKVDGLSKYIFDYADNVLLMSATIIDPAHFAKSLGIDKFKFIDVESTFDPAKAPIYTTNRFKLNRANLEKSLPGVTQLIQQICNQHKDVKGIIHTHTMAITQHLQKNLVGERFLIRNSEANNEQILEEHSQTPEPTVIVSPSMTFGVDLKDDLARFQIIVKAAFLPLSDFRIKRLFDDDKTWYTNKMLCSLVQACGRGNRSKEDYCTTYIIDGMISDSVLSNKDKLPPYFIKRFV